MNLSELKMHVTAFESVDNVTMDAVQKTLHAVFGIWQKQRIDIAKKKYEDEALYVIR